MAEISLSFPDGNSRVYEAGVTPAEVAESIAPSLAKKAIRAQVDSAHWDLSWPIGKTPRSPSPPWPTTPPALELIPPRLRAYHGPRGMREIWPEVKVHIGPVNR